MEADFGGYATKAGLKCSDGRIITPEAFQHMDRQRVPLVWQHGHHSPDNVLGHAILEARPDGVYAYGFFNDTVAGQKCKQLVIHGDIDRLSIYANQLKEQAKRVLHGMIREVSLVLSGANPKAIIDYVRIQHSDDPDDVTELEDEAIIHTGELLEMEYTEEEIAHAEKTVQDVYDSMDEEQKNVLHYMIAVAVANKGEMKQSDDPEGDLEHEEGNNEMRRNVFEQNKGSEGDKPGGATLSHDDMKAIWADAERKGSFKTAVEDYALAHGIENIEALFPDPKTLSNTPEWNRRRMEWVPGVINGVKRSPFSRVKSIVADLTQEEARAKGYITGNYKKEQWFRLTSRITTPTTVYKKQKFDRDDLIDVADFDLVPWVKGEMRFMLEEEVARAILIGDGRDPSDEDKIKDPGSAGEGAGIRAIANENELYATTVNLVMDGTEASYHTLIERIIRARKNYKGSGSPTFYTTEDVITSLLLLKDETGSNRRLYRTVQELAAELRVANIVAVEVMEDEPGLVGIIVNLADYNVGADRGGEVNMFDDFDIDYNQYKYLIETRVSGALTKIKSAIVLRVVDGEDDVITPTQPTFNRTTGVVTVPTQTGVVYKNADTGATLTAGAQSALAAGESLRVRAEAEAGYYFPDSVSDGPWTYTRPHAV